MESITPLKPIAKSSSVHCPEAPLRPGQNASTAWHHNGPETNDPTSTTEGIGEVAPEVPRSGGSAKPPTSTCYHTPFRGQRKRPGSFCWQQMTHECRDPTEGEDPGSSDGDENQIGSRKMHGVAPTWEQDGKPPISP